MADLEQHELVRGADVHSRPNTWKTEVRRLRTQHRGHGGEGVPLSEGKGMRSPTWACRGDDGIKAASAMHDTRVGQWSCVRVGTTMAK